MTIKAVITDIEGTTTPIAYVHRTLFPYARQHLRGFLAARHDDPAVAEALAEVARIEERELTVDEAATVLERWIDEDRKATPLKALQGMIWAQGFAAGELHGEVYADVPDCLRRWRAQGRTLYVYSSGSVEAQQLIYGHTPYGDLRPLFAGYFDTRVGAKREAAAYRRILEHIGLAGEEVVFLSDIGAELEAAHAAGLATCQVLRPQDGTERAEGFPAVTRFDQLELD
jgi:acireductone synthase